MSGKSDFHIQWGLYLAGGLAVVGLLFRMALRTMASVQEVAAVTSVPTLDSSTPETVEASVGASSSSSSSATVEPMTVIPTTEMAAATHAPAATPTSDSLLEVSSIEPTSAVEPGSHSDAGPNPPAVTSCELYDPQNDLLARVDQSSALPRDFEPSDLALTPLTVQNTYLERPLLREVVHQPLLDILADMNAAGLRVTVISGYRSYTEQVLAYEKWLALYPDRAPGISASPGHSEHQLGTAVDFGTPRLSNRFHTNFALTPEGLWLNSYAAAYGFTLSYPEWDVERTGYDWEPWHFRYIGVELAQMLAGRRLTLTQFLEQCAD